MDELTEKNVEAYMSLGRQKGLWRHGAGFKHYCRHQLFPGIDFKGRTMLDIGAGNGKFSLWAAAHGASRIVALEPTGDGADAGSTVGSLRAMRDTLGFSMIEVEETRIQDHVPTSPYDLVLLHYSVNHLDEDACIALRESDDALRAYQEIFRKIHRMMSPGGAIVLTDCSRTCFWARIGMTNPFAPDIEWFKHQSPETWRDVLGTAGFHSPSILWTYEPKALDLGRLLLSNRPVAYFYTSIFVLRMDA